MSDIKAGSLVKIRKGAKIFAGLDIKICGRTYDVTVHRVIQGLVATPSTILSDPWYREQYEKNVGNPDDLRPLRDTNPEAYYQEKVQVSLPAVMWAGTGGYWRQTSIENVDLIK